jgi:hypothetical protein
MAEKEELRNWKIKKELLSSAGTWEINEKTETGEAREGMRLC